MVTETAVAFGAALGAVTGGGAAAGRASFHDGLRTRLALRRAGGLPAGEAWREWRQGTFPFVAGTALSSVVTGRPLAHLALLPAEAAGARLGPGREVGAAALGAVLGAGAVAWAAGLGGLLAHGAGLPAAALAAALPHVGVVVGAALAAVPTLALASLGRLPWAGGALAGALAGGLLAGRAANAPDGVLAATALAWLALLAATAAARRPPSRASAPADAGPVRPPLAHGLWDMARLGVTAGAVAAGALSWTVIDASLAGAGQRLVAAGAALLLATGFSPALLGARAATGVAASLGTGVAVLVGYLVPAWPWAVTAGVAVGLGEWLAAAPLARWASHPAVRETADAVRWAFDLAAPLALLACAVLLAETLAPGFGPALVVLLPTLNRAAGQPVWGEGAAVAGLLATVGLRAVGA